MLFLVLSASSAFAGDLTGRFVYDGKPPKQEKIIPDKDVKVCGKHALFNEFLEVGPDKGIKNIVVYMYLKKGAKKPKFPAKPAVAKVMIDNSKCRFEPRILVLQTNQVLVVSNKDATAHNLKTVPGRNPEVNLNIPSGSSKELKFLIPDPRPVSMSCSTHSWMKSYMVVQDHPYSAVTAADGTFTIKDVPAGEWTFQTWHESGYINQVKTNPQGAKWQKRGRLKIKVQAGLTDLGTIKVPPKDFETKR